MKPLNPKSQKTDAVSVIIPVHNDRSNLEGCLQALLASRGADTFDIIVVDDGSTDGVSSWLKDFEGVRGIRLDRCRGPAVARNVGVEHARHDLFFFVDADVRVGEETIFKLRRVLLEKPELDAVFGSYDTEPGAANLVSQYRNLMHHYVHQVSRRRAFTFWSGCGMIRRRAFIAVGGFDPAYRAPSIEDIELGSRLRRAGYRVELCKEAQCRHMKRWTLWGMIRCDIVQRGIPWTLLLLREGRLPDDLNLRWSHRLGAVLACLLAACLLVGSWHYQSLLLVPSITALVVMGIEMWTRRGTIPRWGRILAAMGGIASLGALVAYGVLGHRMLQLWLLLLAALLGAIVALNLRFYVFLARVKQPAFVPLVIPLHVLYYLYSALAFAAGAVLHTVRPRRSVGAIEPEIEPR